MNELFAMVSESFWLTLMVTSGCVVVGLFTGLHLAKQPFDIEEGL